MLDIKFIRENVDIIKMAAAKKKIKIDIDKLVKVDDSRREIMQRLEGKRAEQKKVSDNIPTTSDVAARQRLIGEMQILKTDIQTDEEALKPVMEEWQKLMLQVPNIPSMPARNSRSRQLVFMPAEGDVPSL